MYKERGTCFPEEVSEKKVLKPSSFADGEPSMRRPSGCQENVDSFIGMHRITQTYTQTVFNSVQLPYDNQISIMSLSCPAVSLEGEKKNVSLATRHLN